MRSKGIPGELLFLMALAALAMDLAAAKRHQESCPECAGRDFLTIAFDVVHLIQAA